jgi:hypothetical protein
MIKLPAEHSAHVTLFSYIVGLLSLLRVAVAVIDTEARLCEASPRHSRALATAETAQSLDVSCALFPQNGALQFKTKFTNFC